MPNAGHLALNGSARPLFFIRPFQGRGTVALAQWWWVSSPLGCVSIQKHLPPAYGFLMKRPPEPPAAFVSCQQSAADGNQFCKSILKQKKTVGGAGGCPAQHTNKQQSDGPPGVRPLRRWGQWVSCSPRNGIGGKCRLGDVFPNDRRFFYPPQSCGQGRIAASVLYFFIHSFQQVYIFDRK